MEDIRLADKAGSEPSSASRRPSGTTEQPVESKVVHEHR